MFHRESASHSVSSSDLHGKLEMITEPLTQNVPDGTAMTSEIGREEVGKGYLSTPEFESLREQEKSEEFEYGLFKARTEDDLRRRKNRQATSRVESKQLPSICHGARLRVIMGD